MSHRGTAPAAARHLRAAGLGAVALAAALLAGVAVSLPGTPGVAPQPATPILPVPATALGEADGAVPDGLTAFDDQVPAIGRLDPGLLTALRRAATDAAAGDHLELRVNSGWRSAAYQHQLLLEAVAEHGSAEEAARWVATPGSSPHVTGDAVDIGPPQAATWLSLHGQAHGLCRVYRNEPWHFELRPEAVGRRCPDEYPDPVHDPRMQT